MSIQLNNGLVNRSLDLVLEDILVRFLVNVPNEDLSSIERVFFQVEEAHWFYTDFCRQLNPALPSLKFKAFSTKILEKCPLIWKWGDPADAFARFGKYKSTIPVRGVALFNSSCSKVLLIKGTESHSWSFPRGKISKDETDIECAIREAEEEIGFNAKDYISENDLIERDIKGKNYKIYLAKNVPENYDFKPHSRNEISEIKWHDMKSLQKKVRSNPQNFFIVAPILKPILRWINKQKGLLNEEELKLRAEVKLKQIMGLSANKHENIDTGRELINILQGVAPNSSNVNVSRMPYEQMLSTIPQILNDQIPLLNNQSPYFYSAYPNIGQSPYSQDIRPARMSPPSTSGTSTYTGQPQESLSHIYLDNQPSPETLRKPSLTGYKISEKDSKELLSILKQKKIAHEVVPDTIGDKSKDSVQASNKSKAESLLGLFKKSSNEPAIQNSEGSNQPRAPGSHDHPAEDLFATKSNTPDEIKKEKKTDTVPKVRILKRPTQTNNIEANAIQNPLLEILHGSKSKQASNESKPVDVTKNGAYGSSNSASELLSLLKKPQSISKPVQKDKVNIECLDNSDAVAPRLEAEQSSTSTKCLSDSKGEFEEFEDFEDFESLNESFHEVPRDKGNYEVESDDDISFESSSYETEKIEQHSTTNVSEEKPDLLSIFNLKGDTTKKAQETQKDTNQVKMSKDEPKIKSNSLNLLELLKGNSSIKPNDAEGHSGDSKSNPSFNLSLYSSIYGNGNT